MMEKKRRIPPSAKIALWILAPLLLIAGVFGAKLWYEMGQMNPLPTGEAAPGVYAVRSGSANFYLLKGDDGYLMIDAGTNQQGIAIALQELGISADDVRAILLTHSDGDHTGALPLFPNAQVYLPEQEVQMIDGTTSRFAFLGGNSLPMAYQTLADSETIELAGLSVRCILTPGHTPGSTCYLVGEQYLFTGDNLSLKDGKADLFNTFFNMDDAVQRASLAMLAETANPAYIFTAHHGLSEDPAVAFGR